MRKKIISLYNKIKEINYTYKLSLLASANTFYMILLIIPLNNIGFDFSEIQIIDVLDIYKWGILFLINLIFVGTRYLDNLKNASEIIYNVKKTRKYFDYLKTLLLTITLVIVVTTLVVISYGLIDIWNNVFNTSHYWYIKLMELVVSFGIILFVVTLIYKYSIPIDISYTKTINFSLVLSLIWLIMSTIYQKINNYFYLLAIKKEYQTIISIYFMFMINYLFVFSFFYNYWKTKEELKNINGIKYNEH